jgi:hypothetical protein
MKVISAKRNVSRGRKPRKGKKPIRRNPDNNQVIRVPSDYAWKVLEVVFETIGMHLNDEEASTLREVISQRDVERYLSLSSSMGLQSINPKVGHVPGGDLPTRVMLSSLLKKYQFPGDCESRKAKAIETVLNGERACSVYNRQGRKRFLGNEDDPMLRSMREIIVRVIGSKLPSKEELTATARHGPGASLGTKYGYSTTFDKNALEMYNVTAGSFDHACDLIESDERWMAALRGRYRRTNNIANPVPTSNEEVLRSVLNIVAGNKITSVPKNALTERSIAIEPEMNMMLQLGVDGFIRKRLKRWGIDLDDQSKNQRLAYEGSIRCDAFAPATIDLAMASDTISLGIAKLLLPEPWFRYLCEIRSPKGQLPDGSTIRFSKLSSMGNGSTFAIESLLFFAVTFAANKTYFGYYPRDSNAVFGDDIACPEGCAPLLVRTLKLCGFSINIDKSFLQGNVKESCGTDWYRGLDMRPVHLTDAPELVGELFLDRNRILRWYTLQGFCTSDARERLDALYSKWIPTRFADLVGPYSDEQFDTYIHTDMSSWRKVNTRKHHQVYTARVLYSKYRDRPNADPEMFDFYKLSSRLLLNEAYLDPARLPQWLSPLRRASMSGSVFTLFDTSRIRRGVRQQVWH